MADQKANIIISLVDKASAGLKTLAGNAKNTFNVFSALGSLFTAGALLGGIHSANAAWAEQERAVASLSSAMKNAGTFTQQSIEDQKSFASELQKTTRFADEQVSAAQALLVSLAKLDGDGLKKATIATTDLATRLGLDLESAAEKVGKSLGSHTNALRRYGIEITGAAGSTERLNSFLEKSSSLFGGAAAADAETYSGKIARMKNITSELAEGIGEITTMLPGMVAGFVSGKDSIKALEDAARGLKAVKEVLSGNSALNLLDTNQLKNLQKQKEESLAARKEQYSLEKSELIRNLHEIDAILIQRRNEEAMQATSNLKIKEAQAKLESKAIAKAKSDADAKAKKELIERLSKESEELHREQEHLDREYEKKKKKQNEKAKEEDKEIEYQAALDIYNDKQAANDNFEKQRLERAQRDAEIYMSALSTLAQEGSIAALRSLRDQYIKEIEMWMIKEMAIDIGSFNFGAAAVAGTQGTAGIAALSAIKLHDGGTVTTSNSAPLPGGAPNERLSITQLGETFHGNGGGFSSGMSNGNRPIVINLKLDRRNVGQAVTDWQSLQRVGLG